MPIPSVVMKNLPTLAALIKAVEVRLPRGSLRRRMAGGSFWKLSATVFSRLLGLAATAVCGRMMGPKIYGELGVIVSTIMMFQTVAVMGLGVTASKHVAEYRDSAPIKAGRIIGMSLVVNLAAGLVMGLAVFMAAPWLAEHQLEAPHLASLLRIGVVMLIFTALNGPQMGALDGFEAFRDQTFLEIMRGSINFVLVVTGVYFWGLEGAVIAYSVTAAIQAGLIDVVLRRRAETKNIRIRFDFGREEYQLLWSFGLPVLVAGLSFAPAVWYSNTLLATCGGYDQMGLFNTANQWQAAVTFITAAVGQIGLPIISNCAAERNFPKLLRYLGIVLLGTTGMTIFGALPVFALAPWFMGLFGPGFVQGTDVLRLLCVYTFISSCGYAAGHAIWSLNRTRAGMLFALMRGGLLVLGAFLWADRGAVGLAWAYIFMTCVQQLITVIYMYFMLKSVAVSWSLERVAAAAGGEA